MDLETLKRATRAKGLIGNIMIEVSFKKSFSVETAHFNSNIFSNSHGFGVKRGGSSKSSLGICFSEFNDQFGLPFFKDQVRKQLLANIEQSMSLDNPFVDPAFMSGIFLKYRSSMFFMSAIKVRKVLIQPIHKLFTCIGNIENRSKVWSLVSVIFGGVNSVDTERSLSIYNTGQIGKFKRFIDYFFIGNYRHFVSKLLGAYASTLSHISELNARLNVASG